jgi:hypothetical protein
MHIEIPQARQQIVHLLIGKLRRSNGRSTTRPEGKATAAHFHGPAAEGANAPPVVPIKGSLASPIKGTCGNETELT